MIESPIFIKAYDMLLWIHKHTGNYPKQERFRLAKKIDDTAFEFYEKLICTAIQENRGDNLTEADIMLRKLTILCRIAKDSSYMTSNQYLFISEKLVELGKMIGAWKKKEIQPV